MKPQVTVDKELFEKLMTLAKASRNLDKKFIVKINWLSNNFTTQSYEAMNEFDNALDALKNDRL
nr:MAG TPA: hypothetical protein [Herelleviridae sp.]